MTQTMFKCVFVSVNGAAKRFESLVLLTLHDLLQHVGLQRFWDDSISTVGYKVLHVIRQHITSDPQNEALVPQGANFPSKTGKKSEG